MKAVVAGSPRPSVGRLEHRRRPDRRRPHRAAAGRAAQHRLVHDQHPVRGSASAHVDRDGCLWPADARRRDSCIATASATGCRVRASCRFTRTRAARSGSARSKGSPTTATVASCRSHRRRLPCARICCRSSRTRAARCGWRPIAACSPCPAKSSKSLVERPGSVVPQVRTYHIADGLRTSEFSGGNTRTGFRANDGTLWLPSIRGIVRVDPGRIRSNTLPPPVIVESVIADGKALDLTSELRAPPGSTNWEFHYAALSMVAPGARSLPLSARRLRAQAGSTRTRAEPRTTRACRRASMCSASSPATTTASGTRSARRSASSCCRSSTRRPGSRESALGAVLLIGFLTFRLRESQLQRALARAESPGRRAHPGSRTRQGSGRGRDARQSAVPGEHEPRDPHADERRHRHDRAAAGHASSIAEQREYVETIRDSAAMRCCAIINDILDFSKIEAGKLDLERAPLRPARRWSQDVVRC